MVEAARTGAIDFRQADPDNPLWWEQVFWVLDSLERARAVRLAEHWYAVILALAPRKKDPVKSLVAEYQALSDMFLPWQPKTDPQAEVRTAEAAWARRFGELNDPATKARIDMTVEAMLKGAPRPKRLGGSTGARRKRRPAR